MVYLIEYYFKKPPVIAGRLLVINYKLIKAKNLDLIIISETNERKEKETLLGNLKFQNSAYPFSNYFLDKHKNYSEFDRIDLLKKWIKL